MNTPIDDFFNKPSKWQSELVYLRGILNDCMLKETYKWKHPCYTYNDNNVVIIGAFKEYCSLNFFKGSLLKNDDGILVSPGENSQSTRSIQFKNINDIQKIENTIKAYIFEAIEVEKAGLKVDLKQVDDYEIPQELKDQFKENKNLETAFNSLTPGRQKGYLIFFSGAKQSKTRINRIEKYIPRIMDGKGLNDCVCGLSKKMPTCDGSHKYIK